MSNTPFFMYKNKKFGSYQFVLDDLSPTSPYPVSSKVLYNQLNKIYVIAGQKSGTKLGNKATAEGHNTTASGEGSHAEGDSTIASGDYSHAEGWNTTASGGGSHAEGYGGELTSFDTSFVVKVLTQDQINTCEAETGISFKYYAPNDDLSDDIAGYDIYSDSSYLDKIGTIIVSRYLELGDDSISGDFFDINTGTLTDGATYYARRIGRAEGMYSHAEGGSTTASGNYSHAEGANTTASGNCSHAEGSDTIALSYSHAEGERTTASGDCSHAEGNYTVASGNNSHAEGYYAVASGFNSHAEGSGTTALGNYSHTESSNTVASGSCSHAEGGSTTASGNYSHAEGANTTASGNCSHAEGANTTASGYYSHAEGHNTKASNFASHVGGKFNVDMTTGGAYNNKIGHVFVLGNGSTQSLRSNAFSVMYNGIVKAGSTITASTTADYAEFFEWLDENSNNEDRVGYFVTLEGNKIRIANDKDDYILGIVSGAPFVLGNGDCDIWNGMYLRDEYRRYIEIPAPKMEIKNTKNKDGTITTEEVPVLDEEGNQVYEGTTFKINPDYDPSQKYISRFDRSEWSPIGMLGVLPVRHDGTAKVNGYITVNENGIATACDKSHENSYRVIHQNSDDVVEVIFR